MNKYIYCTLSIGEQYYQKAIEFAKALNEKSDEHHFLIATDQPIQEINNTTFITVPDNIVKFYGNNWFNYNLKYFPIKKASELNYDIVMYVDSDWIIHEQYSKEKVKSFVDFFQNSEFDFLFERTHPIGAGKFDFHNSFWRHKIEPYNLLNTDKYDAGHVCNEQFLAFKNNDKLKVFAQTWENRTNFAVENHVWPFAEGLEIGMSSIDADMKFSWRGFDLLNSCFMFYSNSVINPYIRF